LPYILEALRGSKALLNKDQYIRSFCNDY
jgi:hypothetical protein